MQNKINKIIWIIVLILCILLGFNIIYNKFIYKDISSYDKTIYYLDNYIYIKIYEKDSEEANSILEEITSIYKKYSELTDRYNGYPLLNNLYYIHNNESEDEWLELDYRLYDLIDYALSNTSDLFDIKDGELIDIWNTAKENNILATIDNINYTDIILKDGKIYNNHANIDLSNVVKGYVNNVVKEYLESVNCDKYLIDAGNNILVGNHYANDLYKIGLEDPTTNNKDIFLTVEATNKAIVTKGSYEDTFQINNDTYSNIINPKTLYPADNYLSVTVITDDIAYSDILATTLFLMDLDSGMELVDKLDGVEAIWYISSDEQVMSKNFNNYIYK